MGLGLGALGMLFGGPMGAVLSEEEKKRQLAQQQAADSAQTQPAPGQPPASMVDQVISQRPDQTRSPIGAGVESFLSAFKPINKLAIRPYEAYRAAQMQPQMQKWQDDQARRISKLGPDYDAAQASMMTGDQWVVPYMMYGQNHLGRTGGDDKVFKRGSAAGSALFSAMKPIAESFRNDPKRKGKTGLKGPGGYAYDVAQGKASGFQSLMDMASDKEGPEYQAFAAELHRQHPDLDPDQVIQFMLWQFASSGANQPEINMGPSAAGAGSVPIIGQ